MYQYSASCFACYRVEAVCPRVGELNPYVHVDMSSCPLDDNIDLSFLKKYQVSRHILCYVMFTPSMCGA